MPSGERISEAIRAFLFEHWFVFFLGALLLIQTLRLVWHRGKAARRMNQNRQLGHQGELKAKKILRQAGYELLEEQVQTTYPLLVDQEPLTARLRADLLVARGGRTYIAEIKAGAQSAKITRRETRRQLFEYQWAFRVDGILLVDAQSQKIVEVRFPELD